MIIEKKIWPNMFDNDKQMPVDFRLADFNLKEGDKIIFKEWDPEKKEYTGRKYTKTVKRATKHNSPTKYWSQEELEQQGLYIIEWK